VKVLVIVNDSPWGATLPATALRLARSILRGGHEIEAVFFRGDGVYNALRGRASETSTPNLADDWTALAGDAGIALLLCSSAASRRLDNAPGDGFITAGLADVLERMAACDRVLSL
jgi:tRNA 2-thiouridine synthesizing protein D